MFAIIIQNGGDKYKKITSVLGREEGYTVKYVPEPKEFLMSQPEWNPEGSGILFTVYPDLSPNTDNIPFLKKDL